VSVTLVQVFSGTIFLHAIEHSSVQSQKLSATWHESCNMIGQPIIVCFVVLSFRLFFATYLFSFHKDRKIEWNSDEICVVRDFVQKRRLCTILCRFTCARDCYEKQVLASHFHASFLYIMTCTSFLCKFLKHVSSALVGRIQAQSKYSLEFTPPRAPFDHIWAMVWSGARGNITITAL